MAKVNKQTEQPHMKQQSRAKRCHGNRRLQRIRRRRYRSKGINERTIEMLLNLRQPNELTNPQYSTIQEIQTDKSLILGRIDTTTDISLVFENRVRFKIHRDVINHYISFQNGIQEPHNTINNLIPDLMNQLYHSLRSNTKERWTSPPDKRQKKFLKQYNMSNDHWKQIAQLIPNYNNLSLARFKHLLIRNIFNEHHRQIEPLLNDRQMLGFLHQRAQLLSNIIQLKIEEDYWKYRQNLNASVINWLSKVPKSVIQQNFINCDHTKTKNSIKHRQQIIHRQLKQAQTKLSIHLQQPNPLNWQTNNQNLIGDLLEIIYHALSIVMYNSLYYLFINFEQKKTLLNFDVHDAYLVKSFYDLMPTKEQVFVYFLPLLPFSCDLYILDYNCSKNMANTKESYKKST